MSLRSVRRQQFAEKTTKNPKKNLEKKTCIRSAALLMLKKFNEALSDCQKAIELDPAFIKAYMRAAKCQVQQGKEEKKKRLEKKGKSLSYCTFL